MHFPARYLFLGLAIGGASAWIALRLFASSDSDHHATRAPSPATVTLPYWSWRDSPTPARISKDSASEAIAAWLALRSNGGENPPRALRVSTLRTLVLRLPSDSFPLLLDPLSRGVSAEDRILAEIALTAWSDIDAPAAAHWAAAAVAPARDLAKKALAVWAAREPGRAAAWICAIPDAKLARALAGPCLATLALHDSSAAFSLARSRDDAFRDAMLPAIIGSIGQKDPASTLRTFAPEFWDRGNGINILLGPIRKWADEAPAAAAGWLLSQERNSDRDIGEWIKTIGDRGHDWHRGLANALAAQPGLSARVDLISEPVTAWARQSPAEALAWIQSLPSADLRLSVLERISRYSSEQPTGTLAFVLALPKGKLRDERLAGKLESWARESPEVALGWVHAHESTPGVSAAASTLQPILLSHIASEDPQAALAEWRTISIPETRLDAVTSIAETWGEKDPEAALRWAQGEYDNAGKSTYHNFTELIVGWAKTDPKAALRWAEDWSCRPGKERDFDRLSYLTALAGNSDAKAPRAATADLYAQIRNPDLRAEVLSTHLREWLTKDPAAAKNWLESHDALTPAQAASLLATK